MLSQLVSLISTTLVDLWGLLLLLFFYIQSDILSFLLKHLLAFNEPPSIWWLPATRTQTAPLNLLNFSFDEFGLYNDRLLW